MKHNAMLTIASLLSILFMTLHLTLVGSLLASGMPVIHVMGAGGVFHGQIAKSSPAFLFVWTLHALGVTGIFSLILSVRGLWSPQWGQSR